MRNTCIHCGEWTGSTADLAPKHRDGCPLREESPAPDAKRLMFDYIAASLNSISDAFFQLPLAEQRARNERAIREMMGPPITYTIVTTAERLVGEET